MKIIKQAGVNQYRKKYYLEPFKELLENGKGLK